MPVNNDDLILALKKYFPERVFNRIKRDPTKPMVEGERRRVTVLFGDLSGFTSLTEKLQDPEEIVTVINRYFSRMLEIVDKYGGDLDKLVGDAIMVLFGAPVAHRNDPHRAVSAALDMTKAIGELGSVDTPDGTVEINMSIGINTGEVVALNMGSAKRMEYTVMGDVVNTASRLEGIANPGEVIISESTYNEVRDEIECEELEKVMLKGKKEPVQIYRARHYKTKGAERVEEIPFVDREEEKKFLLEYIEEVKRGQSGKVSIFGPFGIGKSRLCREIMKGIEGDRTLQLKGREFIPNIPYYAMKEWIRDEYGESVPDGLKIFLRGPEEEGDLRARVEAGWKVYLKNILNLSPLIIRIEDWEHLDPLTGELFTKSEELEGLLIIAESENPIPEFAQLEITPLEDSSIREVSENLLNYPVSEHLLKFLDEKSEGNPYSLKLLLEWLKENELYERVGSRLELVEGIDEEKVPAGFSALMVGRLDSFPEDLRAFIRNASIFGDNFNLDDYLSIYAEKEVDIKDSIETAVAKGILAKRGRDFFFRIPPLREAAYNSIFKEKRKELHQEIASHLEERLGDRVDEWVSILAFHYRMAENPEKAVEYLLSAGDQERRYSDFNSALSHYRESETIYQELGDEERRVQVIENIGVTYRRMGRFNKAKEEIERGIEIAEKIKSERIAQLYGTLALILRDSGIYDESKKYFEKSIHLLEEKGDKGMLAVPYQNLAGLYLSRSEYEKALSHYEKALNLAVESDRLDVSADSKFNIAHIYDILGKIDLAEKSYKESHEIRQHLKDKDGEARVLLNLGVLFLKAGKPKEAEESLKESLKVAEETGNVEYRARANINIGGLHSYKGELDEALKRYNEALDDFREIGSISDVNTALSNIAEVYELRAELDSSEKNYKEALEGALEIGDRRTEAYIRIKLGRLSLWRGNFVIALEEFNKARELAEDIGVSDFQFDAYQFLARVNLRMGFIDRAEDYLFKIEPDVVSNYEVRGRYLLTKALNQESRLGLKEALELGKELVSLGMETGNPGITLDGFGTLLRLGILSNEEMDKIITKTREIIDENVFIVRNLWIILSLAEYYLEIGELDRAALSVNYVLEKAKEHNLRVISFKANGISGRINEAKGNEEEALKDFENVVELLFKIAESLDEEQRVKYFEKYIDCLSSLLHHYYKKKNLLIIISLLKKLPEKLQLELLKDRKDEDPSLTEEIIKNLKIIE